MIAGIVFSVVAAILLDTGNVVQKFSVGKLPEISVGRSQHLVKTLFTSRTWLLGFVLCLAGVGIQTMAFSLTPLAVVQTLFVAGIVSLLLISRIKLHERLCRQEIIGILVVIAAVAAVSSTLRNSTQNVGISGSGSTVVIVALVTLAITGVLFFSTKKMTSNLGLLYGVSSGVIYGVASLGTKGASTLVVHYGVLGSIPHVMSSVYPYVFIAFSLLGMLVFQTGLQRYQISVVGSMADVAASCYLVAAGSIVFGEHWPTDPVTLALRLTGFGGVLIGSVIVATAKKSNGKFEVFPTEADIGLGSLLVAELDSLTGNGKDPANSRVNESRDR